MAFLILNIYHILFKLTPKFVHEDPVLNALLYVKRIVDYKINQILKICVKIIIKSLIKEEKLFQRVFEINLWLLCRKRASLFSKVNVNCTIIKCD